MKLNVSYLDHSIELVNGFINAIEIENRRYFYRIISDFIKIENGEELEEINCYDSNFEEISLSNKIGVVINYFDLGINDKKVLNDVEKRILLTINQKDQDEIKKNYERLIKLLQKTTEEIDLSIKISKEPSLEKILKMVKIDILEQDELIDNLLTLMDLQKIVYKREIIIFVNLKQYLSKTELIELYKYCIYNDIKIILVDSQCYGTTLEYEKKIIIDTDLEEFMIE